MTKKRNTLLRLVSGAVLAMALSLGMAAPAFASGPPALDMMGTVDNPAQAALTKILQVPAGTTTPAADFTFTLGKKSLDDSTTTASLAEMPTLGPKTVSFAAADATDSNTSTANTVDLAKETGDLFAGVVWPHAGVYVYTVAETPGTYTISNSFQEQMNYSSASYDLYVYVLEDATTGTCYVAGTSAHIVTVDGTNGTAAGEKVDPTPGTDGTTLVQPDGNYSQMTFTNSYLKTVTTDPGNPASDSALAISKTVGGNFADTTKYFAFSVTVNNPDIVAGTAPYKAYVVDANGVVGNIANNVSTVSGPDSTGPYIEFTPGAPLTVNLMSGQRLSFVDLYVGSTFTVTEAAAADYTPSCVLTLNGSANTFNGAENTALTVPGSGTALIGEGANSAAFMNTYKTVTPTGVSVDTLPFIIVIGAAVLALIGYIFAKSRKNAKHDA